MVLGLLNDVLPNSADWAALADTFALGTLQKKWESEAAQAQQGGPVPGRSADAGTAMAAAPGSKVTVGGLPATELPGRLSTDAMAALQKKHNTEFAQIYLTGPGKSGGGGTYYLIQGEKAGVQIPIGPNVRWISHSHPAEVGGVRTPLTASSKDMNVLQRLQRAGSPQRTSVIAPEEGEAFRFSATRTHGIGR